MQSFDCDMTNLTSENINEENSTNYDSVINDISNYSNDQSIEEKCTILKNKELQKNIVDNNNNNMAT